MILQQLREQTRAEHELLEARIDLLGRSWSPLFYRSLLEKFYGFYSVIEPQTFRFEEWRHLGINVEERRKIGLLTLDLQHAGLTSTEIEALPRCQNVPTLVCFAQALGCAYVLEGATLGGQIITRHLRGELGVAPESGSAFFFSYGDEVGPRWREFVEVLNSYESSADEQTALVDSARETFCALDSWLDEIL